MRQQRIERLRLRRAAAANGDADDPGAAPGSSHAAAYEEDATALGPGPAPQELRNVIAAGLPSGRRRRVMDALVDVLGAGGSDGGSGSGGESGEEDDELLDWRRKAV